jgi:lysophospholipase L1-like esterase
MQDALVTSLISICEKFGVSYVKAYDPHEFFSVGHSTGIGADQATKRKTLYTLDNTHPNELGYELMSTSFEQFIRRM